MDHFFRHKVFNVIKKFRIVLRILHCVIALGIVAVNLYMVFPILRDNAQRTVAYDIFQVLNLFDAEMNKAAVLGSEHDVQYTHMLQREFRHWQSVISRYPAYRDAYVQLALLSCKMGNMQEAQRYIQRIKIIDPNYTGVSGLSRICVDGLKKIKD